MAWTCKETEDTYNDIWFSVIANDIQGTFINEIAYVYKNCTIEQARKNAYLLAAAPDMYEAMLVAERELQRTCEQCQDMGEAWLCHDSITPCPAMVARTQIDRALKKARGEEHD